MGLRVKFVHTICVCDISLTDNWRVLRSSDDDLVLCVLGCVACRKVRISVLGCDLIVQIQVSLCGEINGFCVGDGMRQLRIEAILIGDILDGAYTIEWIHIRVSAAYCAGTIADLRVSSYIKRES